MEHEKKTNFGENRQKNKSRNTKIKVAGLYWEWSEIDGCWEIKEECRRRISMGYDSEGGNG